MNSEAWYLSTVGKLFEKILLSRVLREVNERGLLRDEQFGFRPKHSTTLQLARLVERVNRNFDESGQLARFSWTWLKLSAPCGSKASSTS
jgi:hypothetical protein